MFINTIQELQNERCQLSMKIGELRAYMTDIFGKSEEEMHLLQEQYEFMCGIYDILADRIKLIERRNNAK